MKPKPKTKTKRKPKTMKQKTRPLTVLPLEYMHPSRQPVTHSRRVRGPKHGRRHTWSGPMPWLPAVAPSLFPRVVRRGNGTPQPCTEAVPEPLRKNTRRCQPVALGLRFPLAPPPRFFPRRRADLAPFLHRSRSKQYWWWGWGWGWGWEGCVARAFYIPRTMQLPPHTAPPPRT